MTLAPEQALIANLKRIQGFSGPTAIGDVTVSRLAPFDSSHTLNIVITHGTNRRTEIVVSACGVSSLTCLEGGQAISSQLTFDDVVSAVTNSRRDQTADQNAMATAMGNGHNLVLPAPGSQAQEFPEPRRRIDR